MKQIYLLGFILVCTSMANAQVLVKDDNGNPIKFEDVVNEYKREQHRLIVEDGVIGEGPNYHFDRWKWYWEEHLDQNGYIVSPIQNYLESRKIERSASKTTADQSDWKFLGPTTTTGGYRGIGRVNAVDFHPTDANTFWVGTSGGGVWKTTSGGNQWTALTEDMPRLDVSDIDVNQQNPNTIYICTGDRDGGSASYNNNYSIGVFKSTDGGQTWNTTGLSWLTNQYRLTNCLEINPQDTSSLILATNIGIYRSFNGGQNWTQVESGHFKQVLYKPGDTSIVYATRYGNNNGDVYRSTDGGSNWTRVHNPSTAKRITLAVTPADPSVVKGIVCRNDNGLHSIISSSNSGASFSSIYTRSGSSCNNMKGDLISGNRNSSNGANVSGCGKQGWYDLSIAVSPTNVNEVFVGAVNTFRSTNGGTSWTMVNQWTGTLPGVATVHADKHWQIFHPITKELIECNDGGIYRRNNANGAWVDLTNGLGVTQYYRNAVATGVNGVLAGSQDNGTFALQGGVWYNVSGGDGMECQIDPVDSNTYYTGVQYGVIYRYKGTAFDDNISDNIPGKPDGAWITPYLISPNNHKHLVAGYKHIYFSDDEGDSWMSLTGSEIMGSNAQRLAMSGGANPIIYAVFPDTQVVFYSKNFVPNSTTTFDTIQVPYSGTISDIKLHPTDSAHFYITFRGYNNNKVAEYNQGVWTPMNSGLPNVPVRCFEYDTATNIVYVGTDLGVYYIDTATNGQWATFRKNMPFIEVTDLGINYATNDIYAATYGRGLWKSVKQFYQAPPPDTTDTTTSVAIIPYAEDVFVVAPNPNRGQFVVKAGNNIPVGQAIKLNVIDFTGKTVHSALTTFNSDKQTQVSLNIPTGMYIIELRDKDVVLGRKRVVVR